MSITTIRFGRYRTMWHRNAHRLPLVALLLAAACGGGPPPPGRVYVVERPPRPRVEVRGAIPGPEWVWVPGHYRWQAGGYRWDDGHWDRVPRGKKHWERGHWRHDRRGWYWQDGRWR
jgi:hypothetical protein